MYERSLAIREKALRPDHPDVANVLNNRALFFSEQVRTIGTILQGMAWGVSLGCWGVSVHRPRGVTNTPLVKGTKLVEAEQLYHTTYIRISLRHLWAGLFPQRPHFSTTG